MSRWSRAVPHKAQDDELVMSLVELALERPAGEREFYVQEACEGDAELFQAVWKYVQAEEHMGGFLRDPLIPIVAIEDPFEPGQVLEGRFRIVREIARGGMGIVYEAFDERLERRIALKCAMAGFRKRLPPEVRNASEISHPNVCKIFEIHTASTRQGEIDFLTMEFLDGETLAQRLKRGPLPRPEALAIALQLCAGLSEAHRKHVVHGDLKSSNVIVTTEEGGAPRAVITDFGLAYRPESAQSAAVGGTPDYMAPELWKGAQPSTATDIYALGTMLRELVHGKGGQAGAAPRSKWDEVIGRCVETDPAGRYATADEVATALAPRTRRWLLSAAAAALLAVISGVAAYRVATTPPETVRLAVLPFEFATETSKELGSVTGNAHTSFSLIPVSEARKVHAGDADKARILLGATHVLHVTTARQKDKVVLHAFVTDTRAQVNTREWTSSYAPEDTRFIPTALAGVVTGTFHLPALLARADVNAAARQDYLSGLEYLKKNSTVESALPPLERALAADPDSPLTHAAMAEAYWWKYKIANMREWRDRSDVEFHNAEQRNPDLPAVLSIGGLLLADSGRLEQAEAMYLRAVEIDPGNGNAYRRLGMAYQTANDDGKALAALHQAAQVDPSNLRNHQALGDFYNRRANYSEALKHFVKTVELAPLEPATHYVVGSTYGSLGRFGEAEKEMRSAINLGESPSALSNLGFYLMYQNRDQEAMTYFNRAVQLWPEHYQLWLNQGTVYRRLNLLADAKNSYQKAFTLAESEMKRNPRDAHVRACMAYASAWLGDKRRAGSEIDQALQFSPNDTDVRKFAVRTYEALGRREDSLKVLEASPPDVLADLSRFPDLADLHRDSRFVQMLDQTQRK
ncbi:MAG: protein kinase [Acidobacteriota bacterium]